LARELINMIHNWGFGLFLIATNFYFNFFLIFLFILNFFLLCENVYSLNFWHATL
jgi:hypothetical protein